MKLEAWQKLLRGTNWNAEHRLGTKRRTFRRAEAVLGAPKAGEMTFAEFLTALLTGWVPPCGVKVGAAVLRAVFDGNDSAARSTNRGAESVFDVPMAATGYAHRQKLRGARF